MFFQKLRHLFRRYTLTEKAAIDLADTELYLYGARSQLESVQANIVYYETRIKRLKKFIRDNTDDQPVQS